jgi:hypothetical protein
MTIQIDLTPEIETELRSRAEKTGVPLNRYVQNILEQHVPLKSAMTPEDKAKAFQDWAHNFPYHRNMDY